MEKKAIKYIVLLLVIPLIISLIITFASDKELKGPTHSYDSISGTQEHYDYSYSDRVKRSNIYVYASVGVLVILGVGTWIYLKKKGEF